MSTRTALFSSRVKATERFVRQRVPSCSSSSALGYKVAASPPTSGTDTDNQAERTRVSASVTAGDPGPRIPAVQFHSGPTRSRNSEILYHSHSIKSSRLTLNSITPVSVRQSRQSLRELRVAHSRMRGLRDCWCAWDRWSARGPRRRFIRKRRPRLFEERVHFCRALLGCCK